MMNTKQFNLLILFKNIIIVSYYIYFHLQSVILHAFEMRTININSLNVKFSEIQYSVVQFALN